jgi:hypothetical protein
MLVRLEVVPPNKGLQHDGPRRLASLAGVPRG